MAIQFETEDLEEAQRLVLVESQLEGHVVGQTAALDQPHHGVEDAAMDREFGAVEACEFVKALQFPASDRVFAFRGETFEVHLPGAERHWDYVDNERTLYRIHTTKTA